VIIIIINAIIIIIIIIAIIIIITDHCHHLVCSIGQCSVGADYWHGHNWSWSDLFCDQRRYDDDDDDGFDDDDDMDDNVTCQHLHKIQYL